MTTTTSPLPAAKPAPAAAYSGARNEDDRALLRAAAELTRDIATANPRIYWADMLGSAALGYGALAGAILAPATWLSIVLGVVATLALYRALLFIHELTHLHRDALPGFRTTWNLLVGIPMLTPSFMYEDGHTIHHSRKRYGTRDDPEYLPLALMKPWSLPVFLLIALLAPPALVIRYGILAPLGLLFPAVRRMNWERFSTLAINPEFRRRPADPKDRKRFILLETGAALWAMMLIASIMIVGWRPIAVALAVFSAVAVLNQLRTLVAHLWENEGEPMSVTAQYLDTVNVPPPGFIAALWAPVGLRYHALHHLLPSLPYHALAEAHRRISAHEGAQATYGRAHHRGLLPLVGRIAGSTMRRRDGIRAAGQGEATPPAAHAKRAASLETAP
ncbi:fatty acid desaturase [Altererythrobacter aerius]|uniref:Fatty acid desaturase n=1 Tax=Tsuneonella aeria TaxID=1837929 RepID=A0A6I4TD18_9SPHN|nr:fatty acid desaturase [Tsuneonella aeria]MXO74953.1 fatty acid desaturase [Tsuneonella aeria]